LSGEQLGAKRAQYGLHTEPEPHREHQGEEGDDAIRRLEQDYREHDAADEVDDRRRPAPDAFHEASADVVADAPDPVGDEDVERYLGLGEPTFTLGVVGPPGGGAEEWNRPHEVHHPDEHQIAAVWRRPRGQEWRAECALAAALAPLPVFDEPLRLVHA